MAIDPKEGVVEFSGFKGLRSNVGADGFDVGDLSVALNVDIDDALRLHSRKGHSAVVVAGVDRDLWADSGACFGVGSNVLKQILPDYSTVTLRSGLTASRPLSYVRFGDSVFYANGAENGCVVNGANRTWGIAVPSAPLVTAASGTLRAGKYQVAVTYLRDDGQESGACRAIVIALADAGGLSVSSISVSADPSITHKNIYVSATNGKPLYRAGTIANAATTFAVSDAPKKVLPLETQFWGPPSVGNLVGRVGARLLVAVGSRLYPSEPYAPELFDLRKGIPFSSAITMLETVEHRTEGCWIGTTESVVWLHGDEPEKWEYDIAADYGVIPGTLYYMDGEVMGDGSAAGDSIAFFATTRGLGVGLPGGKFQNLTQERFAYPIQERGAGIVRRHNGMAQFLVSLQGSETAGNVAS